MTENLILSIRTTENGFLATFNNARDPGTMGEEYVAIAPSGLRDIVAEQVQIRLGKMLDRLSALAPTPQSKD